MTCTLYLVRHAIAEPHSATGDADRELTEEGIAKMRRAALGLKRLGVAPDLVLSSPLRRAQQTADLLREALAPDLRVIEYPQLAAGGSAADVLRGLRARAGIANVVLVGHEPDMGQLASQILTGSPVLAAFPFKKGSVAALQVASLPPHAHGELLWFLTPKQLRVLGGE